MRLIKPRLLEAAKHELLTILAKHSFGCRTSQLIGTPWFHGGMTLTNRQVIRLLKSMPDRVEAGWDGYGYMAARWWKLKPQDPATLSGGSHV